MKSRGQVAYGKGTFVWMRAGQSEDVVKLRVKLWNDKDESVTSSGSTSAPTLSAALDSNVVTEKMTNENIIALQKKARETLQAFAEDITDGRIPRKERDDAPKKKESKYQPILLNIQRLSNDEVVQEANNIVQEVRAATVLSAIVKEASCAVCFVFVDAVIAALKAQGKTNWIEEIIDDVNKKLDSWNIPDKVTGRIKQPLPRTTEEALDELSNQLRDKKSNVGPELKKSIISEQQRIGKELLKGMAWRFIAASCSNRLRTEVWEKSALDHITVLKANSNAKLAIAIDLNTIGDFSIRQREALYVAQKTVNAQLALRLDIEQSTFQEMETKLDALAELKTTIDATGIIPSVNILWDEASYRQVVQRVLSDPDFMVVVYGSFLSSAESEARAVKTSEDYTNFLREIEKKWAGFNTSIGSHVNEEVIKFFVRKLDEYLAEHEDRQSTEAFKAALSNQLDTEYESIDEAFTQRKNQQAWIVARVDDFNKRLLNVIQEMAVKLNPFASSSPIHKGALALEEPSREKTLRFLYVPAPFAGDNWNKAINQTSLVDFSSVVSYIQRLLPCPATEAYLANLSLLEVTDIDKFELNFIQGLVENIEARYKGAEQEVEQTRLATLLKAETLAKNVRVAVKKVEFLRVAGEIFPEKECQKFSALEGTVSPMVERLKERGRPYVSINSDKESVDQFDAFFSSRNQALNTFIANFKKRFTDKQDDLRGRFGKLNRSLPAIRRQIEDDAEDLKGNAQTFMKQQADLSNKFTDANIEADIHEVDGILADDESELEQSWLAKTTLKATQERVEAELTALENETTALQNRLGAQLNEGKKRDFLRRIVDAFGAPPYLENVVPRLISDVAKLPEKPLKRKLLDELTRSDHGLTPTVLEIELSAYRDELNRRVGMFPGQKSDDWMTNPKQAKKLDEDIGRFEAAAAEFKEWHLAMQRIINHELGDVAEYVQLIIDSAGQLRDFLALLSEFKWDNAGHKTEGLYTQAHIYRTEEKRINALPEEGRAAAREISMSSSAPLIEKIRLLDRYMADDPALLLKPMAREAIAEFKKKLGTYELDPFDEKVNELSLIMLRLKNLLPDEPEIIKQTIELQRALARNIWKDLCGLQPASHRVSLRDFKTTLKHTLMFGEEDAWSMFAGLYNETPAARIFNEDTLDKFGMKLKERAKAFRKKPRKVGLLNVDKVRALLIIAKRYMGDAQQAPVKDQEVPMELLFTWASCFFVNDKQGVDNFRVDKGNENQPRENFALGDMIPREVFGDLLSFIFELAEWSRTSAANFLEDRKSEGRKAYFRSASLYYLLVVWMGQFPNFFPQQPQVERLLHFLFSVTLLPAFELVTSIHLVQFCTGKGYYSLGEEYTLVPESYFSLLNSLERIPGWDMPANSFLLANFISEIRFNPPAFVCCATDVFTSNLSGSQYLKECLQRWGKLFAYFSETLSEKCLEEERYSGPLLAMLLNPYNLSSCPGAFESLNRQLRGITPVGRAIKKITSLQTSSVRRTYGAEGDEESSSSTVVMGLPQQSVLVVDERDSAAGVGLSARDSDSSRGTPTGMASAKSSLALPPPALVTQPGVSSLMGNQSQGFHSAVSESFRRSMRDDSPRSFNAHNVEEERVVNFACEPPRLSRKHFSFLEHYEATPRLAAIPSSEATSPRFSGAPGASGHLGDDDDYLFWDDEQPSEVETSKRPNVVSKLSIGNGLLLQSQASTGTPREGQFSARSSSGVHVSMSPHVLLQVGQGTPSLPAGPSPRVRPLASPGPYQVPSIFKSPRRPEIPEYCPSLLRSLDYLPPAPRIPLPPFSDLLYPLSEGHSEPAADEDALIFLPC